MTDKEQVVKHLEFVQGVINRLAHNSFLIKGWSMAIISIAILFISRTDGYSAFIILTFIVPIVFFWILDGYFLWQERLFRGVYDDVRKQDTTDFAMNIPAQLKKPNNNWPDSIFSVTLKIFYLTEVSFIIIVFCFLLFTQSNCVESASYLTL